MPHSYPTMGTGTYSCRCLTYLVPCQTQARAVGQQSGVHNANFNSFASVSTGAQYIGAAAVGNKVEKVHDVNLSLLMLAATAGNMVVPSRCSWGVQCDFVSVSTGGEHGRERKAQRARKRRTKRKKKRKRQRKRHMGQRERETERERKMRRKS
jgi:hypothetical protein